MSVASIDTSATKRALEENDDLPSKVQKVESTEKLKRKNHAILLGYLGKNYSGMQRNRGVITIEETLLTALRKCNLINDEGFNNLKEIRFQRAARTDKGVSAVRQVINLLTPSQICDINLNEHLPNDIQVFNVQRVTKGFNSKNQCDGRTYRYVLPTYAFAPKQHDIAESQDEEERLTQLSTIDGKPYTEYRLPADVLERVNTIAKLFIGTHNFHNYTSKLKPFDPRTSRYIINFSCTTTFVANGVEFAILEIKGQSFLLHQIRKMTAALIAVIKNYISEKDIEDYFKRDKYMIPMVPSLGLVLYHVHYEYYNKRYGNDGIHKELNWTERDERIEQFWQDQILKHITETEIKEKPMLIWLATLSPRHYASFIED